MLGEESEDFHLGSTSIAGQGINLVDSVGVAPAMKKKGRIQPGADADITVFDFEQILDTATFERDSSFSQGVVYVLVDGVLVVRDGETVEGVTPGKAVLGR